MTLLVTSPDIWTLGKPIILHGYRLVHYMNIFKKRIKHCLLETLQRVLELNSAYFSSTGGMTSSGRRRARFCRAWAASRLPVLLNMASKTGCFMLSTKSVMSCSLRRWLSGTGVSHVGVRKRSRWRRLTTLLGKRCSSFMSFTWSKKVIKFVKEMINYRYIYLFVRDYFIFHYYFLNNLNNCQMALLTKGWDSYSVLSIMISLILTEINFPSKTNVLWALKLINARFCG